MVGEEGEHVLCRAEWEDTPKDRHVREARSGGQASWGCEKDVKKSHYGRRGC